MLVLDNEALGALAGADSPRKRQVRRALEAAARAGRDVGTPTLVLAESYRGTARTQAIDSLLARARPAIVTRDTDRTVARSVGTILHTAQAGSADIVAAHVVALAVEAGGGLVLTSDAADLERLAAPYPGVVIERLA